MNRLRGTQTRTRTRTLGSVIFLTLTVFFANTKCTYDVVKARVRVGGDLTECVMCPRGLKQGEICSPILFYLLINELVDEVISTGLSPDDFQGDGFN